MASKICCLNAIRWLRTQYLPCLVKQKDLNIRSVKVNQHHDRKYLICTRSLPKQARAQSPSKRRRSRGQVQGMQECSALQQGTSAAEPQQHGLQPPPSMSVLMDIEQLETLHSQKQKQVAEIYKEFGWGLAH